MNLERLKHSFTVIPTIPYVEHSFRRLALPQTSPKRCNRSEWLSFEGPCLSDVCVTVKVPEAPRNSSVSDYKVEVPRLIIV
jgi:hypothetical protein